jgi:hypothetical protein
VRFAYADPPYLGCGRLYAKHHPNAREWDKVETHKALIERLVDEFPDGWALSASEPSLRRILPLTPEGTRVGAWVKPFASFKPNVNPAWAWEPVMFFGGRKRARFETTVRDWHSANITLKKDLPGAKPQSFVWWVLAELLGARPGIDEIADLFPGTGIVTATWEEAQVPMAVGL